MNKLAEQAFRMGFDDYLEKVGYALPRGSYKSQIGGSGSYLSDLADRAGNIKYEEREKLRSARNIEQEKIRKARAERKARRRAELGQQGKKKPPVASSPRPPKRPLAMTIGSQSAKGGYKLQAGEKLVGSKTPLSDAVKKVRKSKALRKAWASVKGVSNRFI